MNVIELSPEYLNQLASQILFISGILGGFSLMVLILRMGLEQEGQVIHRGRYTLVKSMNFEFQRRNQKPILDGDSLSDSIIIPKEHYLLNAGI